MIVGILVVGAGLIGAMLWNRSHPGAIDVAKVTGLVTPQTATQPAPDVAPTGTKVPQTASLGLPKLESVKPEPPAGNGQPPHFDVVRVEPTGEAVVAGKGDPNAEVALVEGGKVVAETKADPGGNFVILPPPLAPGNHDLTLRQSADGKAATESKQAVAVSVPATKGAPVVVALAEPGKPTRLISGPPQAGASTPTTKPAEVAKVEPGTATAPPPAAAPNAAGLAVRSAELENGNGFYATGVAAPGTHVAVYLNGAHLADVVAGPDGQWSVTIKKGLTGGHYTVRADALDAGGKVIARAEVPFDVPVAMAQATKPAPSPAAEAAKPAPAPAPSETAAAPAADAKVATLAPPADTVSEVPTPRPDIAAAAKAAAAKAPGTSPPILAIAPPVVPADKPQTPPSQMAVAPAASTAAPPTMTAEKPAVAAPNKQAAAAAPSSANAVIEEVETAQVIPGDNLWNISRSRLGFGHRYTEVYAANVSQIRDPKLIYPGQVFVVPAK